MLDTIAYLLNYKVTRHSLRKIIQELLKKLEDNDSTAIETINIHLTPSFLKETHNITNFKQYIELRVMPASLGGLWGDAVIIYWIARGLELNIKVWSFSSQKILI